MDMKIAKTVNGTYITSSLPWGVFMLDGIDNYDMLANVSLEVYAVVKYNNLGLRLWWDDILLREYNVAKNELVYYFDDVFESPYLRTSYSYYQRMRLINEMIPFLKDRDNFQFLGDIKHKLLESMHIEKNAMKFNL